MKILVIIILILISVSTNAQVDTSSLPYKKNTTAINEGMRASLLLITIESFLVGYSYYASKPKAYGDKVVGSIYAGGSVAFLIYLPFYWTNKEDKKDAGFRKERIWNAVIMLGFSYGYSRLAVYNLLESKGDSFNKRFKTNLIESNLAVFVPIFAGLLTKKLLHKKKNNERVSTGMIF